MFIKYILIFIFGIISLNEPFPDRLGTDQIASSHRVVTFTGTYEDCLGAYFLFYDVLTPNWESDHFMRHQISKYIPNSMNSVSFSLSDENLKYAATVVWVAYGDKMKVKWVE